MPVSTLLVEGELDEIILVALLSTAGAGKLVVVAGGSKGSLGPQAREMRKTVPDTCYLRDRDFDFDPPLNLSAPSIDAEDKNTSRRGPLVLGFRWCRHEIESYLLDPRLVAAATAWPEAEYTKALLSSASQIVHYTAARWAVAIARQSLPPFRELPTRPDLGNEIKLPADCSKAASDAWAYELVEAFGSKVASTLARGAVEASLEDRSHKLAGPKTAEEILLWHSGKDLLAALKPQIEQRRLNNPVDFCRTLRDWVRDNPSQALALFPEWQALLSSLQR